MKARCGISVVITRYKEVKTTAPFVATVICVT